MAKRIPILLLFLFVVKAFGQAPEKPSSGEIFKKIQKLNFLGSVLYIAAHPDDENTRLISDLSNHHHARVAYLSLTRGDGGQNLIGSELGDLLGLIRTHELLEARKIDNAEQFFTRAVDFGYSKHSDETMCIWDEAEILSDMVYVIRTFRPDVIINRFDHRSPGTTHGHHTASAIMGLKAFDLAADYSAYPDQLTDDCATWPATRICFNTSWWFYGSQEAFQKADKSKLIELPTGGFDPITGLSNNEVSALSRSQHKSQGFGNTGSRGETVEYLEVLKGEMPVDKTNLFEGINTSWLRVEGGMTIGKILKAVEANFDFRNPSASVPKLLEAHALIQNLADPFWRKIKSAEISEIISDCLGLYLEVSSKSQTAVPGTNTRVSVEMINRSANCSVEVSKISFGVGSLELNEHVSLSNNVVVRRDTVLAIPVDCKLSAPFWLTNTHRTGLYNVSDPDQRISPVSDPPIVATFAVKVNAGNAIEIKVPVVFKENDPVLGEVYKPFEIVPPVSVRFEKSVYLFDQLEEQTVKVILAAMTDSVLGIVKLLPDENWFTEVSSAAFWLAKKGQTTELVFRVFSPEINDEATLFLTAEVARVNAGFECKHEIIPFGYEHIPYQTALLPASARFIKTDFATSGGKIGYIEGAGDDVPTALAEMGFAVEHLSADQISDESLARFSAVVLGIRAYNTVDNLGAKMSALFKFVEKGGNVIVQYNTTGNLKVQQLAPAPLKISRDRVTDENAPVKILVRDHPLLTYPNSISAGDFDGWVQERGLYFPNEWDSAFVPLLSCHDPGETELKGSLLAMKHGEGYFIYTGLSFFRQLPAGVPGAYRLFSNLVAGGKR